VVASLEGTTKLSAAALEGGSSSSVVAGPFFFFSGVCWHSNYYSKATYVSSLVKKNTHSLDQKIQYVGLFFYSPFQFFVL
jgi:hypothetical protein